MKQPRIDDFDPNAPKASALKSTLDHMPVIEKTNNPFSSPYAPYGGYPQNYPFPAYPWYAPYGTTRPTRTSRTELGNLASVWCDNPINRYRTSIIRDLISGAGGKRHLGKFYL